MNEPNHLRRILIPWARAQHDPDSDRRPRVRPRHLPPGNATDASSGQVTTTPSCSASSRRSRRDRSSTSPTRSSSSGAGRERPEEGVATRGNRRRPHPLAGRDHGDRPVPGESWHGRAVRRGVRRRPGSGPGLQAIGETLPVQVIAPAVGVHLPLPDLRRGRDLPSGAAGRPEGRLPCHLARRHPLFLGATTWVSRPTPIRESTTSPTFDPKKNRSFDIRCSELCGLFHGYMFDTGQVVSEAAFHAWIEDQQARFARRPRPYPRTATHYFPDPDRRAG